MLAKHKISVTQPQMVVFQVQFGTNLTQLIFVILQLYNLKKQY